jgi:hypothetical protein
MGPFFQNYFREKHGHMFSEDLTPFTEPYGHPGARAVVDLLTAYAASIAGDADIYEIAAKYRKMKFLLDRSGYNGTYYPNRPDLAEYDRKYLDENPVPEGMVLDTRAMSADIVLMVAKYILAVDCAYYQGVLEMINANISTHVGLIIFQELPKRTGTYYFHDGEGHAVVTLAKNSTQLLVTNSPKGNDKAYTHPMLPFPYGFITHDIANTHYRVLERIPIGNDMFTVLVECTQRRGGADIERPLESAPELLSEFIDDYLGVKQDILRDSDYIVKDLVNEWCRMTGNRKRYLDDLPGCIGAVATYVNALEKKHHRVYDDEYIARMFLYVVRERERVIYHCRLEAPDTLTRVTQLAQDRVFAYVFTAPWIQPALTRCMKANAGIRNAPNGSLWDIIKRNCGWNSSWTAARDGLLIGILVFVLLSLYFIVTRSYKLMTSVPKGLYYSALSVWYGFVLLQTVLLNVMHDRNVGLSDPMSALFLPLYYGILISSGILGFTALVVYCIYRFTYRDVRNGTLVGLQGNAYEDPRFKLDEKKLAEVDALPDAKFGYMRITKCFKGQDEGTLADVLADARREDIKNEVTRPKPNIAYTKAYTREERPNFQKIPDADRIGGMWAFFVRHCLAPCAPSPFLQVNMTTILIAHNVVQQMAMAFSGTSQTMYPVSKITEMLQWDEYLLHVEAPKRALYQAAYDSFCKRPYIPASMKIMAKSDEKQPKDMGQAYTAHNIKNRNLFNPDPKLKACGGHVIKNYMDALKQTAFFGDSFIQGMTTTELAHRISFWWRIIKNATGVAWDGSNHDSHQHKAFIRQVDNFLMLACIRPIAAKLGYNDSQITAIENALILDKRTVRFVGKSKSYGLRGICKKILLEAELHGTTYSGDPSRTTVHNTARIITLFRHILEEAGLVYGVDAMLFQAGDDSYMIIDSTKLPLFKEHFYRYYSTKPGTHGFGQLAKEFIELGDKIDFLSKCGMAHGQNTVLLRKIERVVYGASFSTKLTDDDMPAYLRDQITQMDSWAVRGLPGYERVRQRWAEHAAKNKRKADDTMWHRLVRDDHALPCEQGTAVHIEPRLVGIDAAPVLRML